MMRWPGWSHLPRESRDVLFLLGVIAWTVAPHFAHLPWWCLVLTLAVRSCSMNGAALGLMSHGSASAASRGSNMLSMAMPTNRSLAARVVPVSLC